MYKLESLAYTLLLIVSVCLHSSFYGGLVKRFSAT